MESNHGRCIPDQIAFELASLRAEVATLTDRLNALLAFMPAMPPDALGAQMARATAKARGFYTVETFSLVIGRGRHWVSERCAARIIKILPGGKPYRIPLTEETRWNEERR